MYSRDLRFASFSFASTAAQAAPGHRHAAAGPDSTVDGGSSVGPARAGWWRRTATYTRARARPNLARRAQHSVWANSARASQRMAAEGQPTGGHPDGSDFARSWCPHRAACLPSRRSRPTTDGNAHQLHHGRRPATGSDVARAAR